MSFWNYIKKCSKQILDWQIRKRINEYKKAKNGILEKEQNFARKWNDFTVISHQDTHFSNTSR